MSSSSSTPERSAQPPSRHRSDALEVRLLGVVELESALLLQEHLVYETSGRDDRHGHLLLCEHPPAITVGREGSRSHILADQGELTARQLDVSWLNRGGGCLVHAPGQLAVYPILPLDRLGLGLTEYRRCLIESVLDVCRELRVSAKADARQTGVTCRNGLLAQIGTATKHWVTYHGLFLNVAPNMDLQRLVHPPSGQRRMTSLVAQQVRAIAMHHVRESVMRNLASRLGYTRTHVYTGHPLLKRTTRKAHAHA
jgi:lipoyl(octanoyl) transferase